MRRPARIALCHTVDDTYSTFWDASSIEDLGNSCYMLGYAFGGARKHMSYLIDDVARTLASPMPRRKAFRLIGKVVLGGALMAIGRKEAWAKTCAQCCASSTNCQGAGPGGTVGACCVTSSVCCTTGQCCCPSTGTCSNSDAAHCPSGCSIVTGS